VKTIWRFLDSRTTKENKKLIEIAHGMYEAGQWTESEMQKYIAKNRKCTICERTIQRCIGANPRISKEGWHYFISEEERYNYRYFNPKNFGFELYSGFISQKLKIILEDYRNFASEEEYMKSIEFNLSELIEKIGFFIVFIFLTLATPKEKPKKAGYLDLNQFIEYWLQSALPIKTMYLDFLGIFHHYLRTIEDDRISSFELKASLLQKGHSIIKKKYKKMYRELVSLEEGKEWEKYFRSIKEIT